MKDIIDRLLECAIGRPAKIIWPHRIIHDAKDEIIKLRHENLILKDIIRTWLAGAAGPDDIKTAIDIIQPNEKHN